MRIGIYKDTLANRRGADVAVLALAEGLRDRFDIGRVEHVDHVECSEVVVFEKKDFEARINEPWNVMISTGTNELLDLYSHFKNNSTRSTCSTRPFFPFHIIQQFHTNPKSQFKWKRFVRNWKIRRALKCVSAIQVLSEEFVPQVEKYGAPVHVIGNWSRFSTELRVGSSAFNTSQSNSQLITPPLTHSSTPIPTIIYPAAFAKGKNQKLLIKAFARIAKEFPDWRLRLLGKAEGRYVEECRRLSVRVVDGGEGTRRPARIEFAGYCEDMAAEYESCAFVAFPSLDEGFGLVIADAAIFGKPCVMVKDWIGTGNGEAGGIVTESTVEAYAEGLRRLMADVDLRRLMGGRAKELVTGQFSREHILDKWESLLSQLC